MDNISVCGSDCLKCYCCGEMCRGCNECSGKVFHCGDEEFEKNIAERIALLKSKKIG